MDCDPRMYNSLRTCEEALDWQARRPERSSAELCHVQPVYEEVEKTEGSPWTCCEDLAPGQAFL